MDQHDERSAVAIDHRIKRAFTNLALVDVVSNAPLVVWAAPGGGFSRPIWVPRPISGRWSRA